MSMRARHIVASYLIYELRVDWRHGAAHFEEHLLDYDPALNWVMWMLQTGVMGPKSGRSLGLSHFDAKRPYASQRKQLSRTRACAVRRAKARPADGRRGDGTSPTGPG